MPIVGTRNGFKKIPSLDIEEIEYGIFRCKHNVSGEYISKPFDNMEDAIEAMVEYQKKEKYGVFEDISDPEAEKFLNPMTPEQAKKDWKERYE